RTSNPGAARFYPDINAPLDDAHCQRTEITRANVDQTLRFFLEDGRYLNLRFSPIDAPAAAISLTGARVVNRAGNLISLIAPERVEPLRNLNRAPGPDEAATFVATSGREAPLAAIELEAPLILKTHAAASGRTLLRRFIIAWAIAFFVA